MFTYRKNVMTQSINVKFLSNIISTVGILERQIKFVLFLQNLKAFLISSGAFQRTASSINIYRNIFPQFSSVCQPSVSSAAVWHKPSHLFCSVCCIVTTLRFAPYLKKIKIESSMQKFHLATVSLVINVYTFYWPIGTFNQK